MTSDANALTARTKAKKAVRTRINQIIGKRENGAPQIKGLENYIVDELGEVRGRHFPEYLATLDIKTLRLLAPQFHAADMKHTAAFTYLELADKYKGTGIAGAYFDMAWAAIGDERAIWKRDMKNIDHSAEKVLKMSGHTSKFGMNCHPTVWR